MISNPGDKGEMATLKDIQSCELGILKYFDSVCRKHNLSYSLIGGSMLGAIRHHGFIPWDDDIDVYMPASDCLKLQKLCSKARPAAAARASP